MDVSEKCGARKASRMPVAQSQEHRASGRRVCLRKTNLQCIDFSLREVHSLKEGE